MSLSQSSLPPTLSLTHSLLLTDRKWSFVVSCHVSLPFLFHSNHIHQSFCFFLPLLLDSLAPPPKYAQNMFWAYCPKHTDSFKSCLCLLINVTLCTCLKIHDVRIPVSLSRSLSLHVCICPQVSIFPAHTFKFLVINVSIDLYPMYVPSGRVSAGVCKSAYTCSTYKSNQN